MCEMQREASLCGPILCVQLLLYPIQTYRKLDKVALAFEKVIPPAPVPSLAIAIPLAQSKRPSLSASFGDLVLGSQP